MNVGKIYFVSAPGRIKVGYTRNPERRLMQLRSSDMEPLESIGVIAGSRAIERKLHELLNEFRLRGEWFVDCQQVRAVIADAMAGNFAFMLGENEAREDNAAPQPIDGLLAIRSALDESKRLASEIERRVARRESVTDLVASASFLAEKIIAPGLGLCTLDRPGIAGVIK